MQNPTTYYSHGKLLISGEYVVLDGAKAVAIPTKLGQSLTVTADETGNLNWIALDHQSNMWMEAQFELPSLQLVSVETPYSIRLSQILQAVRNLYPPFLLDSKGMDVVTRLEFPNNWGLGSSSTLINNIAQWAGVDGFELLKQTFGGSGYDIACASVYGPIVYQLIDGKPEWKEVVFNPSFADQLYFVHLGQKQDSREGIARYKASATKHSLVEEINAITNAMLAANTLQQFQQLVDKHENIISAALELPKVKDRYFSNLNASVKSLGAWGGDMVLVATELGEEEVRGWMLENGFSVVVPWRDMVL